MTGSRRRSIPLSPRFSNTPKADNRHIGRYRIEREKPVLNYEKKCALYYSIHNVSIEYTVLFVKYSYHSYIITSAYTLVSLGCNLAAKSMNLCFASSLSADIVSARHR